MFNIKDSILLVIDVQTKLANVMYNIDILLDNLKRVISGVKVLDIPIIITEQYPDGIGHTVMEIKELLPKNNMLSKLTFSCCKDEKFIEKFKSYNRKQVIVCGIETHICVYQTVIDLLEKGYEVQVIADAVSSRKLDNKLIGLELMKDNGAKITCVETILFELLQLASSSSFKEILKIVK